MGSSELSKSKKNRKRKNIVSFDEEIVTKDSAGKHLALSAQSELYQENKECNVKNNSSADFQGKKRKKNKKSGELKIKLDPDEQNESASENCIVETHNPSIETNSKKRKKNKKSGELNPEDQSESCIEETNSLIETQSKKRKKNKKSDELKLKSDPEKQNKGVNEGYIVETNPSIETQNKKRKKSKKSGELETKPALEGNEELSAEKPEVKKEESIRALKRMKHAKLLEQKRLKAVVETQQNVLNYLSKWKHSRQDWKFEKLKQIWLSQNLFDSSKIPSEFWDTAVDYFSESKGFIRNIVLRDALKIIEKAEGAQEENTDEDQLLVLNRARDIVQHLQE